MSYISGTIFQPLPKETTKYHCVALSLSILHALLQNDNFITITFVGRLSSRGWQYLHLNESDTVAAKEDANQKISVATKSEH